MSKVIFVDNKKEQKAKEIIALLSGTAKTEEQIELKSKFASFIKEDGIKAEDQLEYVYVKLGGLVRTEAEQKSADEKEAKLRKTYKKGKDEDA